MAVRTEQSRPENPFDRRLSSVRKRRSDYRRNRRRESYRLQAAYLNRSEAVAKFSSFRQLRFSTIKESSAVTCITSARDAGQQSFQVRLGALRVVFCSSMVMRIASVTHVGSTY